MKQNQMTKEEYLEYSKEINKCQNILDMFSIRDQSDENYDLSVMISTCEHWLERGNRTKFIKELEYLSTHINTLLKQAEND